MNDITKRKRGELLNYIAREVVAEDAVKCVAVIGSVAVGAAHAGSDIDAVVFMDPLDLHAVPAEFQWMPDAGTYHGIFVDLPGAVQFDFKRLDLKQWSHASFQWPESLTAELASGWVAFDRDGVASALIADRTAYTDDLRLARLDDAIVGLDLLLSGARVEHVWSHNGPDAAHDRLQSAYELLVQGVFALNRGWRPWRSRELTHMLALPWLPETLRGDLARIVVPASNGKEGYLRRARLLSACLEEIVAQARDAGLYGDDPVSEAFVRRHDEPGRDWNIADWVAIHASGKPGKPA